MVLDRLPQARPVVDHLAPAGLLPPESRQVVVGEFTEERRLVIQLLGDAADVDAVFFFPGGQVIDKEVRRRSGSLDQSKSARSIHKTWLIVPTTHHVPPRPQLDPAGEGLT